MQASHLHADTLGRALDTLDDSGVTELSRLSATTAAKRVGLAPTCTPLASTSFHVDGRSHSAQEPAAEVRPITRGSSRPHRPDLNHVRRELIVEHQAGMPRLMQPRPGHAP